MNGQYPMSLSGLGVGGREHEAAHGEGVGTESK